MRRYRRYSDRDHHVGPYITVFAAAEDHWRPWRAVLSSGDGDEHAGCHLWLAASGYSVIFELPQLFSHWTNPRESWDRHAREYGFSVHDGFLQVFLGPQTHDSTTTKSWCRHLPWTQWRFVRRSLYDLKGAHFWTEPTGRQVPREAAWLEQEHQRETCPKALFQFMDYDRKIIEATTHIEEMEWRFGEGWFKWLSVFRRPKVRRSLVLSFSEEVGPEKGSWKGGTTGGGIEMLPGELHEAAFRRYCAQQHRSKSGAFCVTFLGREA